MGTIDRVNLDGTEHLLDVNYAEMSISVGGDDELLLILQKICDKIGLDYSTELYASFKGFVTPFDGAYSGWMYDNMVPVGNKIYMIYVYMQSHYNTMGESKKSRFVCYDTETETVTFTKECMYNGNHFDAWILKYIDGVFYAWDSAGYRYATSNLGNTWTREQCTGKPVDETHYTVTTHTGRIIGCPHSYDRRYYLYSDDNGLTWSKVDNPYGNYTNGSQYICSHNTLYEVDNKIVAYLSAPFGTSINQNGVRYVSVSEDDGLTWSEPTACTGDLANAGATYTCGQILHFAGQYHYIANYRYSSSTEMTSTGIGGYIKWYKGSASDLLNGTLSLVDTIYTQSGTTGRKDDFGNGGGCVCNGAMYFNTGTTTNYPGITPASSQGIRLFKFGATEEADTDVPAWDTNYKSRFNALLSAKSTTPRYYFYSNVNDMDTQSTRINDSDIGFVNNFGTWAQIGRYQSTNLPQNPNFSYTVGSADFEVNCIFATSFTNDYGQTTVQPSVIVGMETSDGKLHTVQHQAGNNYRYALNYADTSTSQPAMLNAREQSPTCITFKRKNGVLSLEVNGVTIIEPIYSSVQAVNKFLQNTGVDTIFVSLIGLDGNVSEYETYWTDKQTAKTAYLGGFIMLTIDY